MKNFHIKSIVLGIGIGFILLSVISIIFLTVVDPSKKMSKEEIIREAEKLGMVKKDTSSGAQGSSVANENNVKSADGNVNSTNGSGADISTPQATPTPSPSPEATPSPSPSPTPVPSPVSTPSPAPTPAQSVSPDQPVLVTISPGERADEVADKLIQQKVINDKVAFLNELAARGMTRGIIASRYYIKPGTDVKKIIDIITNASP